MFPLVTDCKGNLFLQKFRFWPRPDLLSPTDCAQTQSAWCHQKKDIKKAEKRDRGELHAVLPWCF